MPSLGRVLIIAGSDSGGGAGIQGDIKTVTCLGGYAATAITALTAQNTMGVFGIHDVPEDFIASQIKLVLDDIGADAIKTGMLNKESVIEIVADTIAAYTSSPYRGEVGRGASHAHTYPIKATKEFARKLRKEMTNPEQILWGILRGKQLGVKFRKQHTIGHYIADFACIEHQIIIELDGSQHGDELKVKKDKERTDFLNSRGFKVLRFWNNELFENLDGVIENIYNSLYSEQARPHPTLPPNGEGIPLVLDPVMFAKGGSALLQESALDTLKTRLIPLAAIITPNIPEAEYLAGMDIKNTGDMRLAAKKILALGAQAVLIKGGHMEDDIITDLLLTKDGEHSFEQPRIISNHTHGTGCTLASAIATGLAQKMDLVAAVKRARDYVTEAIKTAPQLGKGNGPLNHGYMISREEK